MTIDAGGFANIELDGQKHATDIMEISADVTLSGFTFYNSGETATYISNSANVAINDSWFYRNKSATGGGAAYVEYGSTLSVDNVDFEYNSAGTDGGAIYISSTSTLNVVNSMFYDNSAVGKGGAIFANYNAGNSATLSIANSDLTRNSALDGGGVYSDGNATLINNTFLLNSARDYGSGVSNDTNGVMTLVNNIIASSSGAPDCENWGTLTHNNNLIQRDASASHNCGDVANNDILNVEPKAAYATIDGTVYEVGLFSDSPAVDAGDDAACAAAPVNRLDYYGVVRPVGAHCDIGLQEVISAGITRAGVENPTNTTLVQFNVDFSEDVTGVDIADFKLTTSLLTGASVTNVTGSGMSYVVTVNTGTGNGTIRLDIPQTASIYSVSTGRKLWSYYMGETYTIRKGAAPAIPVLKLPLTGVLVPSNPPALTWGASSPMMALAVVPGWHYEINVTSLGGFNANYDTADDSGAWVGLGPTGASMSATLPAALPANTTFTWKVRAYNDNNQYSAWSLSRTFRTKLATPELNLPVNNSTLLNKRPTFEWDAVSGASGYTIQVLKKSPTTGLFTVIANTFTVTGATYAYTPTVDLLPSTQYAWKVKANGLNAGDYSAPFIFTTSHNPPKFPVQSAPATGLLIASTGDAELKWGAVLGVAGTTSATTFPAASNYDVQVSTNAGFVDISANDNVKLLNVAATTTWLSDVLWVGAAPDDVIRPGRTYYWRVRAWDNDGHHSAWSASRTIKVKFVAPQGASPIGGVTVGSSRPTFQLNPMGNGLWTNITIYVANAPYPSTLGLRTFTVNAPFTTYTIPNSLPPLTSGHKYWYVKINGLYTPISSAFYWDFWVP
jgi:predicted outer membrane repeat protein